MSREIINRKKVEWQRASCLGLETDLLYAARTELVLEGLTYNHLRRICFSCPIQKECLQVGTAYEQYGFWGGLSEDERRHIYAGKFDTQVMAGLRRDLEMLGKQLGTLTAIVRSVQRDFTFNK